MFYVFCFIPVEVFASCIPREYNKQTSKSGYPSPSITTTRPGSWARLGLPVGYQGVTSGFPGGYQWVTSGLPARLLPPVPPTPHSPTGDQPQSPIVLFPPSQHTARLPTHCNATCCPSAPLAPSRCPAGAASEPPALLDEAAEPGAVPGAVHGPKPTSCTGLLRRFSITSASLHQSPGCSLHASSLPCQTPMSLLRD